MSAFLCAIPLLATLASGCEGPPLAVGYVEGEYVLVAPIETAQIVSTAVKRGDRVAPGVPLAELEKRDAEIAVAQARAALAQSESVLANLRLGRRPEEIAAIQASLASAKAQAEEAGRVFQRQSDLRDRGIATQANYDAAQTNLELSRGKVVELEANLAAARLPARADEIKAAEAAVAQARAVLDQAEWRLSRRSLTVPVEGIVSDILRTAGEVAGPQAPVLSVLPEGATKLKLYVPEPALASVAVGNRLKVSCDGCGDDAFATVSYVSPDPEFTPPVIYSLDARQKLVYLVEARPDAGVPALKPGQIVDVTLEPADAGR
jgi:Multidrug resistance efflux pump